MYGKYGRKSAVCKKVRKYVQLQKKKKKKKASEKHLACAKSRHKGCKATMKAISREKNFTLFISLTRMMNRERRLIPHIIIYTQAAKSQAASTNYEH